MAESKLETNRSQEKLGEEEPEVDVFELYLIRPEMIDAVWDSKTPNADVQKILLEFINDEGERTGQDLRTWNEFESRYEENELKWISDYVVSNLVFIKNELKITDNEAISHVLHVLWTTLDLFAENQDLEGAKANRYENLRNGLAHCFE